MHLLLGLGLSRFRFHRVVSRGVVLLCSLCFLGHLSQRCDRPAQRQNILVDSRILRPVHFDILDVPEEIRQQPVARRLGTTPEEVVSDARIRVYLVVGVAVEQVADGLLAAQVFHFGFEELEVVVGISIDDGNSDIVIGVVGIRGLVELRGAGGDDVG